MAILYNNMLHGTVHHPTKFQADTLKTWGVREVTSFVMDWWMDGHEKRQQYPLLPQGWLTKNHLTCRKSHCGDKTILWHLIFTMGSPIQLRWQLYIISWPRTKSVEKWVQGPLGVTTIYTSCFVYGISKGHLLSAIVLTRTSRAYIMGRNLSIITKTRGRGTGKAS